MRRVQVRQSRVGTPIPAARGTLRSGTARRGPSTRRQRTSRRQDPRVSEIRTRGPYTFHSVPRIVSIPGPNGASSRPARPPWSERLSSQNIVGESFHEAAFKALAADTATGLCRTTASRSPRPGRRSCLTPTTPTTRTPSRSGSTVDTRSVTCRVDVAAAVHAPLEGLGPRDLSAGPSTGLDRTRSDWDERSGAEITGLRGQRYVRLPEPDGITASTTCQKGRPRVLPWGRAAQITGEEHHMDVLRTFALGSAPRHVAATLHVIEEYDAPATRSSVVEVRLDGERVGVMSKAISEQISDLVTYVATTARPPSREPSSRAQTSAQKSSCMWPVQAKYPRSGSTQLRLTPSDTCSCFLPSEKTEFTDTPRRKCFPVRTRAHLGSSWDAGRQVASTSGDCLRCDLLAGPPGSHVVEADGSRYGNWW